MRKRYFLFVPVFFAGLALFMSCTDFFSTSLASWAARDPDNLAPPVTASNVNELIALAENNPDLSLAVLKKIQAAVNEASGDEKQKLQGAAIEAAVNASGLGHAVLGAAGDLTTVGAENSRGLFQDAVDSMKNLEESSSLLLDILPNPNTPEFDNFAAAADPNDLALAAALIIAGEAKKVGDFNAHLDSIAHDNPQPGPETMAVALAKAAIAREDELSQSIKDVLKGLNLIE